MLGVVAIFVCITLTSAYVIQDEVVYKLDDGPRYQYLLDDDGTELLVDLWVKISDLMEAARYNPDTENAYHLFTRKNPTVSQPLLPSRADLLSTSNYDASKRTVVIVHGWRSTPQSGFNTVLVPAFLAVEDVNLIMLDWSAGAGTINYPVAAINVVANGEAIARFITWLNVASGSNLSQYHLVGFSLGAHAVGVIGRNLGGQVPYITALDPAGPGFNINSNKFNENDGIYTEVIHTNGGLMGYLPTLGKVDFYPNGGVNMPGCGDIKCNHDRSYHYFAETLSSTGFIGQRCQSYLTAVAGTCVLPGSLTMGGLVPKTGETGIFHVKTNAAPPFAQG